MSSVPSAKPKNSLKNRKFLLTLNQPEKYEKLKEYLTSRKSFIYFIAGKEKAPTTGHDHIHIFVAYSNAIAIKKTMTEGANVQVRNDKPGEAGIAYVKKDCNVIEEIGEYSTVRFSKTVGDLCQIQDPKALDYKMFNTWIKARQWNQSMSKSELYKPGVKIFYIWGESGVGKTKYVWDQLKEEDRVDRVKFINGFWTGVSYDPTITIAWYDDFRSTDMRPSEFVNFIDYYSNNMNVKGGHVLNRYQTIFITSIFNPKNIYQASYSEEDRQQWLRRMEIIHVE